MFSTTDSPLLLQSPQKDKENLEKIGEAFKVSLQQTTSFCNYCMHTLLGFHQPDIVVGDLFTGQYCLETCNYPQCCMNTQIVALFIYAMKYFAIYSWAHEQTAQLIHWES